MEKKLHFWKCFALFLLGFTLGQLIAPSKNGFFVGSFNGNEDPELTRHGISQVNLVDSNSGNRGGK